MKSSIKVLAVAISLVAIGCSTSTPIVDTEKNSVIVTKEGYEATHETKWGLGVDELTIECVSEPEGDLAIATTPDGVIYGLNGTAIKVYNNINDLKTDEFTFTNNDLLEDALELCE